MYVVLAPILTLGYALTLLIGAPALSRVPFEEGVKISATWLIGAALLGAAIGFALDMAANNIKKLPLFLQPFVFPLWAFRKLLTLHAVSKSGQRKGGNPHPHKLRVNGQLYQRVNQ